MTDDSTNIMSWIIVGLIFIIIIVFITFGNPSNKPNTQKQQFTVNDYYEPIIVNDDDYNAYDTTVSNDFLLNDIIIQKNNNVEEKNVKEKNIEEKVQSDKINEYRSDWLNFNNVINGNSNGVDIIDKINEVTVVNESTDITKNCLYQSISDIYDKFTTNEFKNSGINIKNLENIDNNKLEDNYGIYGSDKFFGDVTGNNIDNQTKYQSF